MSSALAFEATVEGRRLEFGTTGKLRNSDLVMYDRQTESWWQQFSGRAIVGEMTGKRLRMIPVRVEGFERFRSDFPEGDVLVPEDPRIRDYGRNPYVEYDSRSAPYPLYDGALPDGIDPMARVVVVRNGKGVHAVTLERLRRDGAHVIGGVRLTWSPGQNSALDSARIDRGRDVGNVIATEMASGADAIHDVTFAFVVTAFHPDVQIAR